MSQTLQKLKAVEKKICPASKRGKKHGVEFDRCKGVCKAACVKELCSYSGLNEHHFK